MTYPGVKKAKAIDDYKIRIIFDNNKTKIFNLKPYLEFKPFQGLKDQRKFRKLKVSFDTIEWPHKVDIDPEILYKNSIPTD